MSSGSGIIGRIEMSLGLWGLTAEAIPGGQGRTFRAVVDGEPVVVKWGLDPELPDKIGYLAGQVEELRRRGTPAPRIGVHGRLRPAPGYGWVQQLLPGTPAVALTDQLLDQLLVVIDGHADAPAGAHRGDFNWWASAVVHHDEAGWWANTRRLGGDARLLCDTLKTWVDAVPAPRLRHDYVHADLNLSNILVDDDRVSGVIDLENLGIGDRTIDVARLAFEAHAHPTVDTSGLLRRLVGVGRAINGESGWRTAVTYEVISRLGWRSEHHTSVDPSTLVPTSAKFLEHVR